MLARGPVAACKDSRCRSSEQGFRGQSRSQPIRQGLASCSPRSGGPRRHTPPGHPAADSGQSMRRQLYREALSPIAPPHRHLDSYQATSPATPRDTGSAPAKPPVVRGRSAETVASGLCRWQSVSNSRTPITPPARGRGAPRPRPAEAGSSCQAQRLKTVIPRPQRPVFRTGAGSAASGRRPGRGCAPVRRRATACGRVRCAGSASGCRPSPARCRAAPRR